MLSNEQHLSLQEFFLSAHIAGLPEICFNKMLGRYPHKALFDSDTAAAEFLRANGHQPTPLYSLTAAANKLKLASLLVKDESRVLGQKSFKMRGAAWAIAQLCCRKLQIAQQDASFAALRESLAQLPKPLLFVSATDGNHGAAVAAVAASLRQKAVIFLPAGAALARVRAITALGASCVVSDCNYDDTVALASQFANEQEGLLIQDTAWPGYAEIPLWIMQGYATIAGEIAQELAPGLPTHVFLQAGVGSFAASIMQAFANIARDHGLPLPRFISVEPACANCVYQSIKAGDGEAATVCGPMATIMAGLACGQPSSLAWPILRDKLTAAASCPDWIAEAGIQILATPLPGDPALTAGASAVPGLGLLRWLMTSSAELGAQLGLGPEARALIIATEGQL
ncbi:MAG: diaminopropionate ammonia-lyase [Desulfovibrio sp.]|nr:diaminopropionate ammonia-lyase [Desulfovibrio sp.]